ncbi:MULTISPECIES: glycosyltransferase [unclassified Bradyrhizobium]|uniref:glycosyltransferase family 2 protein n=1 Tax=unclassified Bradyrhizobium TaxID=2631580 RepID=UPI001FFB171A
MSIVINNYNYACFLKEAIESALNQTYSLIEIVVVDDGSSDGSREIIASYGDRVVSVLKENGGQASALNAGVSASRGDVLCFLDSDDYFYPDKVAQVIDFFCTHGMNSKPTLLHHGVAVKNLAGDDLPASFLARRLHQSPMNLYNSAKRYRFLEYLGGPTTGISINRMLADRLFPIPEKGVRVSADDFIVYGSFLIADAYSMDMRLSAYRLHGSNYWYDSDRLKTREFRDVLDKYLNTKLIEDGKQPVISFYDSMFAWSEFVNKRQWTKLAAHMLKLSWKQRDLFTATYVWHTVIMILRVCKRALIQSMPAPGGVRSPSKS